MSDVLEVAVAVFLGPLAALTLVLVLARLALGPSVCPAERVRPEYIAGDLWGLRPRVPCVLERARVIVIEKEHQLT